MQEDAASTIALAAASETVSQSLTYISTGNLVIAVLMPFALNYLWSMVNSVQMIVHLPAVSL